MLKFFLSIGSYSSEVRSFGTLITSTKVFGRAKRAPHWGVQSKFRVIYVIVIPWLRGIIVDNCPDSRGRSPSERAVSI